MMLSRYRRAEAARRRRAAAGRSQIYLSREDRMWTGDPVEKQQPRAVVELVLHGPRLEPVGGERDDPPGARYGAGHHEPAGPSHVAGEIGYRHASLATGPPLGSRYHACVTERERPMTGTGLRVRGDIHREDLSRL